ncbi:MAG: hypothetical protein KJO79_02555 [Verrucomicrobiae bacterium]|nr:hypothetical protein [Verrucomicrobiae bacterium]NNJ86035.1 hypothetical protein [Akkermansiaceae bacterium]
MSDTMSPYQPPQAEMPDDTAPSANTSVVPKVFGILHLVFGGLGLLFGVIGLVSLAFQDKLQEIQFSTYPENVRDGMQDAMQPLYEAQQWDIASSVGSLILAVLLIVAGLKLVRYRKQGRKISNIYSALSIVHKLFAIGIVVFVKAPAMRQVGESIENLGGQSDVSMGAIMGPMAIITGIATAVIMMVYPILSFFMLGKKQVSESLK